MHILNIYDPANTFLGTILPNETPMFKRDGDEFKRQAGYAYQFYTSREHTVYETAITGKNRFGKADNLLIDLDGDIDAGLKYDRINFFCHGGKRNLNRGMFDLNHILELSFVLSQLANPDCKIVLYSCWTGALLDGFAHALSMKTGLDVLAHTTRGHTTKNPRKVLFRGIYWPGSLSKLWVGIGVRQLRKQLWKTIHAPFKFVEEVFNDNK